MWKKDRPKLDDSKVGGLAFFFSLIVVIPLAIYGTLFLFVHTDRAALANFGRFALGAVAGATLAKLTIRGHTSVFIHELKHSIIANLVGNKATEWRIRKHAGHFQYEFTEKTRGYNAFISLAPYWLPLFTLLTLGVGLAGWHSDWTTVAFIVGIGWGADALLNLRDIAPYQTDFSDLRGGFPIGITYVTALNSFLTALLLTFIGWGTHGLKLLGTSVFTTLHQIVIR